MVQVEDTANICQLHSISAELLLPSPGRHRVPRGRPFISSLCRVRGPGVPEYRSCFHQKTTLVKSKSKSRLRNPSTLFWAEGAPRWHSSCPIERSDMINRLWVYFETWQLLDEELCVIFFGPFCVYLMMQAGYMILPSPRGEKKTKKQSAISSCSFVMLWSSLEFNHFDHRLLILVALAATSQFCAIGYD
jgi:hypothetical protein